MKFSPIIIVSGEPNSIFFEIFLKSMKNNKFKSPIILIASKDLLNKQIKFFKSKIKIKELNYKNKKLDNIKPNSIYLIDVKYHHKNLFDKISINSKNYINKCFEIALEILNKKITKKLINGPVSKKFFLNKKYPGITEYLAQKTKSKNVAMIIFNKTLSVSPLTTHLPIKYIVKRITKLEIEKKVKILNSFWINRFKKKPKIAITGLNPHCESLDEFNEDDKIIKPSVIRLKKQKYNISGPFPADTIFLKKNRSKYNIIIGMYHDQVLTPIKTLFEYDAINITVGLPFIRVSPDHGTNEKMVGKNLSNPLSLIRSIQFLDF
jgi:4-hydroxythreonine-4-phosphate dehydrogenase